MCKEASLPALVAAFALSPATSRIFSYCLEHKIPWHERQNDNHVIAGRHGTGENAEKQAERGKVGDISGVEFSSLKYIYFTVAD